MSYILGDIASRVRLRIRDTSYSSSETIQYVNDTVNDVYNEYRLPFMETTSNGTMTALDSDIYGVATLPIDYVQAIDLIITTQGQERRLPYRDADQIAGIYPDSDDTTAHPAGQPEYWYKYADTIRVFPTPNAAYTFTLRYYKRPALLSANADIPSLPSEFEELIVVGASYRIMQVKDNYDQAGILENKYDELLQKLVSRYSQTQTGTPHTMGINRRGRYSAGLDTIHRRTG
jgi:hypothetical protein